MTTAGEDIRDVLTLLQLVKERPCLFKTPHRGTGIAYGEVQRAIVRLNEALSKVESRSLPLAIAGFVCADPDDDSGWRVKWNGRLTSPRFNSHGAADAYLHALADGTREPEYST